MSKNYQVNAPDCEYCGIQLDIDALYHNRKCCKYNPNCGQRMYMLRRKIKKGIVHENKEVKKWCIKQNELLSNKMILGKEIDPQITLLLRTKTIESLDKLKVTA